MKSKIEAIEGMAGVPIGKMGDPRQPILKGLEDNSLPTPNPNWVWKARAGRTEGTRFFNTLNQAVFTGQSSGKKDVLYHRVADKAVSLRTNGDGVYAGRYAVEGYFAEVSGNLRFSLNSLKRCIRAMRVDLVYGYKPDKGEEFSSVFQEVVEDFITGNTEAIPPSLRPKLAVELDEKWDRQSPVTFYRTLYQLLSPGSRAIAIWIPYEVKVQQHRYHSRIIAGSTPLTPFDEGVAGLKNRAEMGDFAKKVTQETGIFLEPHVVNTHRNALLYSHPTIKV